MFEDAAPVAQAARLAPYSADYRSVVKNKGAMIFHMVRAQMGDVAFKNLLRDYYFRLRRQKRPIEDFVALRRKARQPRQKRPNPSATYAASSLSGSTPPACPNSLVEYVVYRTTKASASSGKIKQPIDTFRMPVEIRIDTEGNPEIKTIDVIGTESPFTVETFGRPKPGGIRIDPTT